MNSVHEKYKNWKSVPMPKIIADLPRDDRGYPIPANVLILDGKPVFAGNDGAKETFLMITGKCSITGTPVDHTTIRLITSPLNAFADPIRVLDAPVHVEALRYSMQVCPYLCLNNYYRGFTVDKTKKFNEKYKDSGLEFVNLSKVDEVPPFMVEIHPGQIKPMWQGSAHQDQFIYIVEEDWVLGRTFWKGGEVIDAAQAAVLLEEYCEIPEIKQRMKDSNMKLSTIMKKLSNGSI